MKPRTAIALSALVLAVYSAVGQNVPNISRDDRVSSAIQEFNKQDKTPNEVTVVLPPPDEASAEVTKDPATPAEITESPTTDAVVPKEGLAVRVEKFESGSKGAVDPGTVKLLAPFPAKPLAAPPAGWVLDSTVEAPPFTREVEVAPGTRITLTIRPHVLVPEANGADVVTISEPGYDSESGYRQKATVGAALSNSLRQLDEDSDKLDAAIENLQQLLISLPSPEPETKPESRRKS